MLREEFQHFRVKHSSLFSCRVEGKLLIDRSRCSKKAECHHSSRMELHRLTIIFGIAVFFSEILAFLEEHLLVWNHLVLADDTELAILDDSLLHTVVSDNIDRILVHLVPDARRIAGTHHDDLIPF